jgi:hypothetical protein
MLVKVSLLEDSKTFEILIPYPDGDIQQISQCVGKDILWKAQYIMLYVDVEDIVVDGIGC